MTVVACRAKAGGGFEVASDSITVRGWTQRKSENTTRSKLTEVNGIVIGSTGKVEESVMMQLFLQTHNPLQADERSLLEMICEFSDWKKARTDVREIENDYIFGIKGKLFETCEFSVHDVTTYTAIGAGMDFALAALHLGKSPRVAVETAIELSVFCESPVIEIESS